MLSDRDWTPRCWDGSTSSRIPVASLRMLNIWPGQFVPPMLFGTIVHPCELWNNTTNTSLLLRTDRIPWPPHRILRGSCLLHLFCRLSSSFSWSRRGRCHLYVGMSTKFFVAIVNNGRSGVSQNYEHLAIVFRAERPLEGAIFSMKT